MSTALSKNGYSRLPTEEPGSGLAGEEAGLKKRAPPRSLRPGLFYMFGDRGRYAQEHSDSEEVDLSEAKPPAPRRPKHRKAKSPKSPKTPVAGKCFRAPFALIEEPILADDTVQRVALRYSCPVSDADVRLCGVWETRSCSGSCRSILIKARYARGWRVRPSSFATSPARDSSQYTRTARGRSRITGADFPCTVGMHVDFLKSRGTWSGDLIEICQCL